MLIRQAQIEDREAVNFVCLNTGDSGNDASTQFNFKDMLGDLYAAPYLESDPDFSFVLEDQGTIKGYVLGTLDSNKFAKFANEDYLPRIRAKYQKYENDFTQIEKDLWKEILRDYEMSNEILKKYPSHLHIDLLPEMQGKGHGTKLMNLLLEQFKKFNSPGVHLGLAASNLRAFSFYEKMGFSTLSKSPEVIFMGKSL